MQMREDESGILRSQQYLHSLIREETQQKGISPSRVVLGGFSQGGAMSLLSGITYPEKLAGVFGLSCYMLLQGKLRDMIPRENPNKETSIFMGHGKHVWGPKQFVACLQLRG